jgi:hypothetical protein
MITAMAMAMAMAMAVMMGDKLAEWSIRFFANFPTPKLNFLG